MIVGLRMAKLTGILIIGKASEFLVKGTPSPFALLGDDLGFVDRVTDKWYKKNVFKEVFPARFTALQRHKTRLKNEKDFAGVLYI